LERILVYSACFVIIVAGMRAAAPILVPFLLAIFIAIITTPLFLMLRRWGIRTGFAFLIILIALIVFSSLAVRVATISLSEFTRRLPEYGMKLQNQQNRVVEWLKDKGVETPEPSLNNLLNPQEAVGYARNLAATLSGLMGNVVIILLIVVFVLLEVAILPARLRKVPGMTEEVWPRIEGMFENVRQYMTMKTWMSVLTGALVWLWLEVLRIDHALLLGMLAFVLNFIPAIGSIMAGVPGIFLALILYGPGYATMCLGGYLVINIAVSNVLEPRVMGRGFGLSPLMVFLSVIFWGWVLGPVGMLLSVPITLAAKLAMESGEETRWLALLLGPPARHPPAGERASLAEPTAEA
jgi:predicted PurR-regulated permease PerM